MSPELANLFNSGSQPIERSPACPTCVCSQMPLSRTVAPYSSAHRPSPAADRWAQAASTAFHTSYQLAPAAPFTSDHVRRVTDRVLDEIAPRLDHDSRRAPDWGGDPIGDGEPLIAGLELPNPGRPPSPASAQR